MIFDRRIITFDLILPNYKIEINVGPYIYNINYIDFIKFKCEELLKLIVIIDGLDYEDFMQAVNEFRIKII